MSNRSPDGAARTALYTAVVWLVVGVLSFALASAKLVDPDLLATRMLSYGRLRAVASIALQYGWLGLGGTAAIFYVLPRVTGVRMRSETSGILAALLLNLVVGLGVLITLATGPAGPEFSELPRYLDAVLVVTLLMIAANVFRTAAKRTEPALYVSVWHFCGAAIWAPLAIALGNLHSETGVGGSIAGLFSINATLLLWFASAGLGALYYLLPKATEAPLYSHRLAMVGFWALALAGPLAGQSRQVFGPSQDWLQTLATAASIVLLIPGLTTVINVFGTLRGSWSRLTNNPSVLFLVGGTLFFVAGIGQQIFLSFRSVARFLGTTEIVTSGVWLFIFGAFGLWTAGLVVFAFPRLMGHNWSSRPMVAAHFWFTTLGTLIVALSAWGAGLVAAALINAGVVLDSPVSFGEGFSVVATSVAGFHASAAFGAVVLAIGQVIFAINLFRSTSAGAPRPIEMVTGGEVPA